VAQLIDHRSPTFFLSFFLSFGLLQSINPKKKKHMMKKTQSTVPTSVTEEVAAATSQ
jgi:hypothetical protein